MGSTYTRQSSTEIVDGEVIQAADFNNEFSQLVSAFAASTGHTHDGTSAEGGPVTKLLGTAITIGDGTSGTDIAVTFDGETTDGLLTWMEDEDHFKFSDDVVLDSSKRLYLYDEGGEYIYGDGTDLYLVSGADINIPANIGLTFGDDGEKIEGDGTDLTIAGNNINLTATADVNIPSGVGVTFATAEKIESDGTDLSITVGSGGDINIPADIGVTFGNDGEKIEGDGTDLTITGNNINLTATADVVVPADVGITFGTGEKIEGNNTDITVTSGADINLTATSDVNIPSGVGVTFGDDGEKIEGDGTDLTISGNNINLTATADVNIPSGVGVTFGNAGEKIEGDGTDLTISGNNINLTATADVNIPSGVGVTFATAEKIESDGTDLSITVGSGGDINIPADIGVTFGNDGEKIEGDGTDLTISGNNINLTATADVNIPSGVGLTFATGEKLESDGTDLSITVGSNGDINIPADIGLTFGDDGEKIEGDGTDLTISASALANIDAGTDIVLDAGGGDIFFKDDGTTFGSATNTSGDLIIKSGTTTAMTFSGANVTFAGTVTIGSASISEAELEILDSASVTTTELNLIDGDTARGTTAVASGDGILINDAGTMRMTNVDTVSTYFASHNVGGGNIVTTGALDSGSITSGFGAIDNGTSGIRTDTFTAETSIVPDASDGATIGSASLEWSDLYLADEAVVYFGDDQEIKLSHVQDTGLTLKHTATADDKPVSLTLQTGETDIAANDVIGKLDFQAPDEAQGTDAILVAAGIEAVSEGDFSSSNNATKLSFKTAASEAAAEKMSLSSTGNLTVSGDLTISGDDLFMGTNTSGHILVADGTNYNPVAVSGDISLSNTGAAAIASGVIVNADVNASAAIADTKLGTIQTAGKVALSALEIDGASDIGEGIADADLFIVDNGAGGTNTKVAASRLKTYIGGGGAWNFISEANLSTGAAAGIDFTSGISSTYDVYMFHLLDIISTNDANALQARVYTGSSALEDDSGDYRWVTWARSVSTTGDSNISVYRNHSANAMMLNNAVNNGNASGENTSGIFMIYNANSSGKSYMKMDGWMIDNDGTPTPFYSYGVFEGTAVITGMRFFSRDSNTESGTVRMYGLAKS